MNRIISLVQSVLLRVILTALLIVSPFLLSATFGYGNSFQAQAKPLTPEATKYQVDHTDGNIEYNSSVGDLAQNTKNKVESIADNARENLNQKAKSVTESDAQERGKDVVNTVQNKLENAGDDIREKLNLDQPIYPGTKEFLNDVQDRVEKRVQGERPEAQDAPRAQRS